MPDGNFSEPKPPEKRSDTCPECERLWKAYALATRNYLDANHAEEVSAGVGDTEKMKFAEAAAIDAARLRELARKAVRDHAAMHASEKPKTPE